MDENKLILINGKWVDEGAYHRLSDPPGTVESLSPDFIGYDEWLRNLPEEKKQVYRQYIRERAPNHPIRF